jgi:hypothetical protein
MSRRPHQPTPKDVQYVEALASYGVPEEDIARVIGVTRNTLRKHYSDQLENGQTRTNAQVAGFLFSAAKKGSVPAMMFWLRCRAGWSDASAGAAVGKKEAALVAARAPDVASPFGRVIAERAARRVANDVGSQQPGLGKSADAWPVSHSRSAA